MRILIYSDVHWSMNSSIIRKRSTKYSLRLEQLIKSMNWVERLGESYGCDLEVCAGDFMDKSNLTAEEITALREITWSSIPKKFLVGNHDSSINSLEFNTVSAISATNIQILSQPATLYEDDCALLFLPYSQNYEALDQEIQTFAPIKTPNKFIFSHADIKGLSYGRFQSETGLDYTKVQSACNMLFNGHLHEGNKVADNIINIGSLSANNFTNNSELHDYGAYIVDTKTRSIEFVVNPYAFNFYKLFINSEKDLDKLDHLKPNAVVSVTCLNNLVDQVKEKLNSIDLVEYKLITTYSTAEGIEDKDFKVEDHLTQFIDFVYTKLETTPILKEEVVLLGDN